MKPWTLADVAAHWDSTLEYDDVNEHTDSYFRRFTDSAPLFAIPDHACVLDIDCRTAKGTSFFLKKYPTARFMCVAMSPRFERLAREELQKAGLHADVEVLKGFPLPHPKGSFDVILSYETLEHMPDPHAFAQELARLAKPGALLVLTTPNVLWEPLHALAPILHLHHGEGPHRMIPRREILRMLRDAGWQLRTERTFVLIPAGPRWFIKFGKWLERISPEWFKRIFCLRRTFLCRKKYE
ncbi:MAG: class I SAM-dependent methyltransferase [Candidatus Peribacteraceae bacterium]|nr:class I SAM-dependent methyltransferase [Candidatus Peribacteraceae bacterium]